MTLASRRVRTWPGRRCWWSSVPGWTGSEACRWCRCAATARRRKRSWSAGPAARARSRRRLPAPPLPRSTGIQLDRQRRHAAQTERLRHQRRGRDRLLGTRGGVFRQKITQAERILATVLRQRGLCTRDVLAHLFDVSPRTIGNAFTEVVPLLEQHGWTPAPGAALHHRRRAHRVRPTRRHADTLNLYSFSGSDTAATPRQATRRRSRARSSAVRHRTARPRTCGGRIRPWPRQVWFVCYRIQTRRGLHVGASVIAGGWPANFWQPAQDLPNPSLACAA